MSGLPVTTFLLKIFNGPLQGCEFRLKPWKTFFVVGSETVFCVPERLPAVPEDAIYVPLEQNGCNFEVVLSDVVSSRYILRLFGAEEVEERSFELQTLLAVAGLRIAVKLEHEEWAGGLDGSKPVPTDSLSRHSMRYGFQRWLVAGVVALLMLGSGVIGWRFIQPNAVSTVEALIAGSNSSMTVLYGRDQAVYIFADSEHDANWGRQVLVRNGFSATQVLTIEEERSRLERALADLEPQLAYHRLDFSNPSKLRVLISNQRNLLTLDLRSRLETEILKMAPYALSVEVDGDDDEAFELRAAQGLKRLGMPFNVQRNTESVSFSVVGSLDDGELQALTSYVAEFQQLWGNRYVNFTIELKDDWLKGRSFQYGPQGYIKMTPSSWYFPKPL